MPVATIPFKLPAAFELPAFLEEQLADADFAGASHVALAVLGQMDAFDAAYVARHGADGWLDGPFEARTAAARAAMAATLDAPGASRLFDAVLAGGQPLLLMGEVAADATEPLPPAWRDMICGDAPAGNVGFLYALPLGQAGVLVLHRQLASGPLNHDQPALAAALAARLADRPS